MNLKTTEEICTMLGITRQTLTSYRKKYGWHTYGFGKPYTYSMEEIQKTMNEPKEITKQIKGVNNK